MTQLSTITTKRQLTLPAKIFKRAGLKTGQKVMVTLQDGQLIISPAAAMVEKLAGSLAVPKSWKGKDVDQIIEFSKKKHFKGRPM